jgi:hypothetical protein
MREYRSGALFNFCSNLKGEKNMREMNLSSLTPSRILRHIMDDRFGNAKEYTYTILGNTGPTGKNLDLKRIEASWFYGL